MALRWLVRGCVFALLSGVSASAWAQDACPKAGTLGVSRTVEIDTTGGPGFGMEHYKAYDFLQDKEVVLTFDDGPDPAWTPRLLDALEDAGAHATFFVIAPRAAAAPHVGGQAMRRVITPGISSGAASTSSAVTSWRSTASGLRAACRLALARIFANVASGVPYRRMCARPAPPK